jgi:predicted nucleic acid-binding protein
MIGVIDASALIRLFVPDGPLPQGLEEFFQGAEQGRNTAIAPELLIAESVNVINRKRKSGEFSEEESDELLTDLIAMPIRYYPHQPIIQSAYDFAKQYELTVYDALYLALSVDHGAVLFTADQKLRDPAENLRLIP